MIEINQCIAEDFYYFEALFFGGNLYAFTLKDLLQQLQDIHIISLN